VIIKTYNLQLETYNKLFHIDSYRLKSGEELKKLGWQEIISNPQNLILIEWPENVSDVIPQNAIKISFEFIDETTRKINLISK
jgi:tRNA threonylcarbamoyladenosine biosynthesis protein TsaE